MASTTPNQPPRVLVTGGAGFIGSALLRYLSDNDHAVTLNVDKLTYAGNLESLKSIGSNLNYSFLRADITNADLIADTIRKFQPTAIMHLAAESHVDRSIDGPSAFMETNIIGTYTLLQCALEYWRDLGPREKDTFRFHHISTDEVYGDVLKGRSKETDPYRPSSPYAASKASSDHLVYSYVRS